MPTSYLPPVSMDDMLNYHPDCPETKTVSSIVNAVVEVLLSSEVREGTKIAKILDLDPRKLSAALEIETGLSIKELIISFRLSQIRTFMKEHPDSSNVEVARHFGFPSPQSFWRYFQINTGETPSGRISKSPKIDNYAQMVKKIHKTHKL